jgi:hypothetical protein
MKDIENTIADEYADEHFPGTVEDIHARLARRRRTTRRLASAGVAGTVAVGLIAFAVLQPRPHTAPPPIDGPTASASATPSPGLSTAEFDAQCQQQWEKDKQGVAQRPPLRFDEQSGGKRLRIYADDVIAAECTLGADGKVTGGSWAGAPVGTPLQPASGREVEATGTFSLIGDGWTGYYLGRAFPTMSDIVGYGADGRAYRALVNGDLFLLWLSEPSRYEPLMLTARTQQATVIADFSGVQRLADLRPVTVDTVCRKKIDDLVHHAGLDLPDVSSASTTLVGKAESKDHRTWLYRRGRLILPCDQWQDRGRAVRLGTSLLPDGADDWRPGGHVEIMAGDMADKWARAFGTAPPGLTSLRLHLPDGQTIAATVKNGYFLALWQTSHWEVQPDSVTATINGKQYRVDSSGSVVTP